MGCLYVITSPSGKQYVGITSGTADARWKKHQRNAALGRDHRRGSECVGLYNAIRKYGASEFSFEVLASGVSWEELCSLERAEIRRRNTCSPHGYNLTEGGEGAPGAVASAETRAALSAAQRRLSGDPEHAANRLEYLRRAVAVRAEKWHGKTSEEKLAWAAKAVPKMKAWHATPEGKQSNSLRSKKMWDDADVRNAIVGKMRGAKKAPWTQERKDAAAAKRRLEWADPEMRAKRVEGMRKAASKSKAGVAA